MIVVTVFEPNGITIWFKNCHHDHIPFTVKGNGNIVFSVQFHPPQPTSDFSITHTEIFPASKTIPQHKKLTYKTQKKKELCLL